MPRWRPTKTRKSGANARWLCGAGPCARPSRRPREALFLTSGYAYENAEEAEARFKGEIGGYQYSRYANPTVTMFEERMAALEGAPVARATATGMAAVSAALLSALQDRRSCGGGQGHVRLLPHVVTEILPRFGITYTLVDGGDVGQWQAAIKPNTNMLFLETPSNPTLVHRRSEGGGARSRTRPARGWWSTMPSPARRCSGRWSSAPISWSIPRPNISTARAARWAA